MGFKKYGVFFKIKIKISEIDELDLFLSILNYFVYLI